MIDCPACHDPIPNGRDRCPSCGAVLSSVVSLSSDATGAGGVAPRVADDDALTVLPSTPRPAGVSLAPPASAAQSADAAEFGPGMLLADRYRIVALLGRGGMGEVYRADDLRLGQPVALKFLPRALERDPTRLDRFLAEVRTARQVSHANVCRVYDVGEIGGRHFLSMEYVDGEDLASLLRRIGRLPSDKAIEIARQLCAALAAAHDKGVLHRDLKPANVMLDGRGKVRLTDFGLAEPEGQAAGDFAGTPAYMAPEQFSGKPATVRSDIYALGLVLYEVFSGRRAFEAPTLSELRRLHEESHADLLSSSVRDLDPAVERVIFRCLEKDPASRPASAMAVAAALPGGDPLAAALAAGETPSPEMVAASGDSGTLRPAVAAAWLAATMVGVLVVLVMATAGSALSLLPLADSPDVTRFKAREILSRLGYRDTPADSAFGYRWDSGYTEWAMSNRRPAHRWDDLSTGHLLLRSWHRTSPEAMSAARFLGGRLVESGHVLPGDPPLETTGMTFVEVDAVGRLVALQVVPPQLEPVSSAGGIGPAVDWTPLLAETGIDAASLVPAAPRWAPAVYADQRAAWTGRYRDLPDLPVTIEAAAVRGKPVSLKVVLPWTKPSRDPSPPNRAAQMGQVIAIGTLVSVIAGALVFARRNLALGRGDRKGATRLAGAIAAIVVAEQLLEAHHVAAMDEVVVLLRALCWTLYGACFAWVLYLALEPPIRRRWPATLVSWNRLLTGRVTDPLVGRHVLVGVATGTGMSIVAFVADVVARWFGQTPSPSLGLVGPLSGITMSASWLLLIVYDSVFSALALFFLVFLLRLVLRKDWLAAGVWAAVSVAQNTLGNESPWINGFVAALVVGAFVVLLFRCGIVSFATASFVLAVLTENPLTGHLTSWYGTPSVVALLGVTAVAVYGYRVSTAGKPLLGASVD